MPGVLEFARPDGTVIKYCLVPNIDPPGPRQEYQMGLPITASPRLTADRRAFRNPLGAAVPNAVPIFENDFWAPDETLLTITRWLCYPINFGLFKRLPLPLIESLMRGMKTEWQSGRTSGTYEVHWGGLPLTRRYAIVELEHGVAIWPRRALPGWKEFFLLFAPGTAEADKTAPFAFSSPSMYACGADGPIRGDTAVLRAGKSAMCRSHSVPRLVALTRSGEDEPAHGVMPLLCDASGKFEIPGHWKDVRSPIVDERTLPHATSDGSAVVHVSVDFGTTNTAVAVSTSLEETGTVLQFSDEIRALKLTGEQIDPAYELTARFGFFPMNVTPTNPLSTMILETEETEAEPFAGLSSLPCRNIPGDRLDENAIRRWTPEGLLKQEFKWQKNAAGMELRAAFLEVLARFVGWELRTRAEYQRIRKAQLVFTCPLSFSQEQTEGLLQAQRVFQQALTDCGFDVTLRDGLVSESLANLHLIRKSKTGVGEALPEERHVVVDIGGGSTDISVFTGSGEAVFLDSLYIGGRDLAEVLLAGQVVGASSADKKAAVTSIFGPEVNSVTEDRLGQMLQLLLVLRFKRSVNTVAEDFARNDALRGTPADLLALLAFCAAYGIRAASLGGIVNGKTIPEASDIRVWFVGLGSRLFELCPLAKTMNNRLATARKVLEDCGRRLVGSAVTLQFDWGNSADSKLTVCRGALLVPADDQALDLKTIYWAGFPEAKPSIAWSDPYDRTVVKTIDDAARRTLSTVHLEQCAKAAFDAVKSVIGFEAEAGRLGMLMDRLKQDYSRGISAIASNSKDAPPHPVAAATDGLKENLVALFGARGR